jgi:hypothetical protein
MGVGSNSQKMLKNLPINEKTKNSVHKCPLVEDMKRKIVQKKSQVMAPRKWG